ncbi:uncharacterized protein LOC121382324 isoform X2 [Gigantopelta aegis]|uniref:uncharacterized protein LOC121382324 isoform X2 n=1 Tax=Gigantopelta aegis TaxID=1735272 RepID=UPI001B889C12|nr:uncharacterized protein LOC121382324 isoform X2 [Gigantopelta aegis]
MEIKKQMSADPNGCYVVDMMPNLRFLVQSSELVKNPKEEMESFENEYPVSFAINFDNPPERLTKEHANSKNSQSGTQAVPGTKSDEADYGRTKRRATLFQNSVRPFINYFLQSDRLVNVDVSSGALDLVWEKICSIFLELNFRNRFNVNSVIIFSFDGEHMDSIELGKYSLRHINLKDHLQDPVDSQENVCSTLCGVIDGSDPTVEVFLVNLEGTSINKQMKFEVKKHSVLFVQEDNSFLHAQVALNTKNKDSVHFKAVSSTSSEVCLFPMETDTELCKQIALMMAECRKNS